MWVWFGCGYIVGAACTFAAVVAYAATYASAKKGHPSNQGGDE